MYQVSMSLIRFELKFIINKYLNYANQILGQIVCDGCFINMLEMADKEATRFMRG